MGLRGPTLGRLPPSTGLDSGVHDRSLIYEACGVHTEVAMLERKCYGYGLVVLAFLCPSCQRKVDVEKEQQAITAVIDAEKKGYFDKSLEEMAATWVQDSSSVKVFMSRDGEVDLLGWPKINEHSKQEIGQTDSTYQNIRLQFSDFRFYIYETSAWAIFKAHWNWSHSGQQEQLQQERIMAFEKVGGEWKITLMAIYSVPPQEREGAAKAQR